MTGLPVPEVETCTCQHAHDQVKHSSNIRQGARTPGQEDGPPEEPTSCASRVMLAWISSKIVIAACPSG
jgi:hypothetical protein